MHIQQGDLVRVKDHVPLIKGRMGVCIRAGKSTVKVVLGRLVFELRPINVKRVW